MKNKHLFALGLLGLTLSLGSCSLINRHKAEQLLSQKAEEGNAVLDYLKNYSLDHKEQRAVSMPKSLDLNFDIQDSTLIRQKLWQLWARANATALAESQMNAPKTEKEVEDVIWKLPQEQQMKLYLMTKEAQPKEGYPFLINLHGGGMMPSAETAWGGRFNDAEWQAAYRLASRYAPNQASYYLIPRMADDRIGRWYLSPQIWAFQRAVKIAFLTGKVNPYRTYLLGISEGGYGSHRLALFMPDYFAAFGPMAAAEPLRYSENLRNTAFHMEVGELDRGFGRNTLAKKWQEELSRLQKTSPEDFHHEVNVQAGRGHGVNYFPTVPRMLKETRRIYPKHLSYTYHDMTPDYGERNYSRGVYYLDFRGLKHNKGTLKLDIIKEGNSYNIQLYNQKVSGKLGLFVDKVDFSKPVIVKVNGKVVYEQKLKPQLSAMISSLVLWGDPLRLFPAKIELDL